MVTDGVVVDVPAFGFVAHLSQAQKAPRAQDTIAINAVAALDEAVLGRLSRLGVLDDDATGRAPSHEGRTGKLRTMPGSALARSGSAATGRALV